MRVLVAGYAYEDSFADNVQCALRQMGHEVRTLGDVSVSRHYSTLRRYGRALRGRTLRVGAPAGERRLLKIASAFRPHLVLALTREYTPGALRTLRKSCHPTLVSWWADTPANVNRWGFIEREWDLVFLKDAAAVRKARIVRADVYHLQEAMNPTWHRPLGSSGTGDDLVVAGNCYPFRQSLVARLLADGHPVSLYGAAPPAWALPSIRAAHSGRYIFREEKSRIFGEGLAVLNSFSLSEGDSLNCRAFEIAGAAGLQMLEHRPAVDECFEPGRELLCFETYEELQDLIMRAKRWPAEMRKVREAGARRAHAHHTYRHRLDVIFDHLR